MNYVAILSNVQTQRFLKLFFELEVGRMTDVHLIPIENGTRKEIHLNPQEPGKELLIASFTDGMLNDAGWSESFKESKFDYRATCNRRIEDFIG